MHLLIAIILTLSLALTACGQKNISETEAKENALNYLDKAFNTTITQADIVLMQHERTAYENNQIVLKDHEPLVEYYRVSVNNSDGASQYYAEVDAKTGTIDYVYQNMDLITLTEEQQKQADAIGTYETFSADRFSQQQKDAAKVAVKWVQDNLEPMTEVHSATTKDVYTDQGLFPVLVFDSIVTMKSGTIYHVSVCWPAMEVISATIFNQDSK